MAIAGSLTYDTKLDTKGFKDGLNKIGGIAKGVAVGVGASITAIGTGLSVLVKNAVDNYAEYEQLAGGVKSIFSETEEGLKSIAKVTDNANNAWKDLTMSQNDYYKNFTSTYPLMKNDIEDQNEAIEQTNRLMKLESDLANTFGYSVEEASTAINWALKGSFNYIDNLNLGIKGTQEGFLEAAHNAGYMVDGVEELTSSDILDILEKVADQYGVLGKTAAEARTTIQGSTKMMRSAWSNLLNGIADDNADFDKLVGDFVEAVGYSFDNLLPRIMTALEGIGNLIPKLIDILMQHLPEIMEAGQNIINGLMQAIIQSLPTLITTGTQILQSLLNGIVEYIPQLIPVITQVIMSIVQLIIDNLPTILEAGVQILFALMQGIAEALPDLVSQIVNVIIKIMEIFNENFDTFLLLGVKIILGLIEGLIKSIPDILANLPTIIMAIINFFTLSKFLSMGKTIIKGIWSGLSQGLPNLIKEIPKLIGKIINAFKGGIGGIKDIGKNLVTGLWNGINNAKDWVLGKIKGFGKSILKGLKSFFGIKSPSRLMRDEVGKFLPQGIAVGIEADTDKALDSIDKMNNEIYDRMKQAVNMETGKMAFSGTTGSVSQILSSNATFDGNFVVKAEVQEGTLFEANQRITKEKRLQTGFGG